MTTPKVFISSTLEDLGDYRTAAEAAIKRLEWSAMNCGYWAAGGNPPLDTCLQRVDDGDVVVVIVAHRHGWTPPGQPNGEHKSITRLECERAKAKKGIEVIPFLVDKKAPWDAKLMETHRINEAKPDEIAEVAAEVARNVQALNDFKSWLDTIGTRKRFSSPPQLETEVLHALTEWGKRQGLASTTTANASIRAQYLDWLRRSCESVELLGLDLKDTQNVRLGQVYVPAVTAAKAAESDEGNAALHREQRFELLLHRLGEGSLYVPGAPGAGKSTFCRWLALCVATGSIPAHPIAASEEFEERLPSSLQGRFPLLCRLREWAGHPSCLEGNGTWSRKQLEDSLACWLTQAKPGGLTHDVFRDELATGQCLLILDGVDEVPETSGPHLPRRNLLSGLADALPDWIKGGNLVLLTSRPYGLDDHHRRQLNLPIAELAELPDPLQHIFIRRWYAAADPPRAAEKSGGLIAHFNERRDLDTLRPNPMLLTALCVKYDEGQRLPKDFFRLYDSVVNQVLYKRYGAELDRERARLRLSAIALGMHEGTATEPRVTPLAEVSIDEVDRLLAELANCDRTTEDGSIDAAIRRENLLSNSGLLLPRSKQRAAFYHLSFQEFFAALRLRRMDRKPEEVLAQHAATPEWRKTLTFYFCAVADQASPESAVSAYEKMLPQLQAEALEANPNPALLLADCLEVAHARGWRLDPFAAPFRRACEHALQRLRPPERAYLWRTLGRIELDHRAGVGVKNALPDIDWVEVPGGSFQYGDHREEVHLDTFHIARYPLTNAQFQAFTDDPGGYANDHWWEGLAERSDQPKPPRWNYANHPRESVSWYEAMAFCRWLDARLRARGEVIGGWQVRLPTEREWEKAARGTDGREFPWGDFQSGYANINETLTNEGPYYLQQTSAVGVYPQGRSPYEVMDMAGNVWEWCLNKYHAPADTNPGGSDVRVLRGGSWLNNRNHCRCAYRNWYDPDYRYYYFGFRVCCSLPIS